MRTAYVVKTVPLCSPDGEVVGWVRANLFADGSDPRDQVYLRDGSAWPQKDAVELVRQRPDLLYPTRDAAVRAGIDGLRDADRRSRAR